MQKVHLKGGFYIPLQQKNRFNDEQKHGDCRVLATTDDGTSDHPLNLNRDVLRFGRLVPDVQPRKCEAVPFILNVFAVIQDRFIDIMKILLDIFYSWSDGTC